MVWNRKEPPKIVAEVAQKLEQMKQPIHHDRPLLEQIHADRLAKQVKLNALDLEVTRLRALEDWLERHPQADSLVVYFVENLTCATEATKSTPTT